MPFFRAQNPSRRVCITGIGIVSPLANTREGSWRRVLAGESGAGPITHFRADEWPVRFACEVRDFELPPAAILPHHYQMMNRPAEFGLAATLEAITDAGIDGKYASDRCGVCMGVGIGTIRPQDLLRLMQGWKHQDRLKGLLPYLESQRPTSDVLLSNHPGTMAALMAERWNAGAGFSSVMAACSASGQAIGQAFRSIQRGHADVMIAGGADSLAGELLLAGFCLLGVLSKRNDDPASASRPFDKNRDGFVASEGAAVLILEEREHAVRRGAKIYCEVSGFGETANAYRVTDLPPDGRGAVEAMESAVLEAKVDKAEIGYLNAHGTSTEVNDRVEAEAIRRVFGKKSPPISSTKSEIGHLVAAAGGIELAFAALALRDGAMPPNRNLEHSDCGDDLDFIVGKKREGKIDAVMSNSLGFGGTCVSSSKEARMKLAITGVGITSPLGNSFEEHIKAWWSCEAKFSRITRFDSSDAKSVYAGDCGNVDLSVLPDRKVTKMLNRRDLLSVTTCMKAARDAAIARGSINPDRMGIYIGVGSTQISDLTPYFDLFDHCIDANRENFDSSGFGGHVTSVVNPLAAIHVLMNNGLSHITQLLDIRGTNGNYFDFEVASMRALGEAMDSIAEGRIDVAFVGGVAAPLDPFQIARAYHNNQIAAKRDSDDTSRWIEPYGSPGTGTLLSEAAGFLVVESTEFAAKRGARVLGHLSGYAAAFHTPADRGLCAAVETAGTSTLKSRSKNQKVAAVIGSGRGLESVDSQELSGLQAAMAAASIKALPLTSVLPLTGDVAEATGVISIMAALAALKRNELMPAANCRMKTPSHTLQLNNKQQAIAGDAILVSVLSALGAASTVLVER